MFGQRLGILSFVWWFRSSRAFCLLSFAPQRTHALVVHAGFRSLRLPWKYVPSISPFQPHIYPASCSCYCQYSHIPIHSITILMLLRIFTHWPIPNNFITILMVLRMFIHWHVHTAKDLQLSACLQSHASAANPPSLCASRIGAFLRKYHISRSHITTVFIPTY